MDRFFARIIAWTALVAAVPQLALADLSENTILQSGQSINMDTGAVAGSGGDLLWNGSTLAPQGSAKASRAAGLGATNYNGLPQSYWAQLAPAGKTTTISGLIPGDAVVVQTNSGKAAKLFILANSGGALTLEFTTFGATAPSGVPVLTAVLNNSSQIPFGYPQYGIAPSSLFIVQGVGMADPGAPMLQSSAAPGIPLSLNGCSITVVVGGVTVHPALYYTSPTQIAAVLPAATPVGTGTLTVTYQGTTSVPITMQVVAAAVGFNFFNQLGNTDTDANIGVATDNSTGSLFTFANSAAPGETIVLWSTGLGADAADSDTTYTLNPHAVATPLQIYFGGALMTVLYAGSAGFPGVNEIIFTLPQNVLTGCYVPLVAVTGSIISNVVNLPVNKGGGACLDSITGLTGGQVLANTQNTLKTGGISLGQTSSTSSKGVVTVSSAAGATFEKYTGLLAAATGLLVGNGACTVGPLIAGATLTLSGLDAGTVTLTGPAGLSVTLAAEPLLPGSLGYTFPAGVLPSTGGTYTFTGSGGADVGPFTSTLALTSPLFNWTNTSVAATVVKTQGLTATWTGGNPGSVVIVGGSVAGLLGNAGFTCRVAAELGQFTVPSYILLGMPAGSGGVNVQNDIAGTITVPTGLDQSGAQATISFSVAGSYQ